MKITILLIPFILLASLGFAQTGKANDEPHWSLGLQVAPDISYKPNYSFTGFSLMPGIYRTMGQFRFGFVPFYRYTNSTNPSGLNPENENQYTYSTYGALMEVRYYLNAKRLRPYVFFQAGGGYTKAKYQLPDQFTGTYTYDYGQFNVRTGFGAAYMIDKNWMLDVNFTVDYEWNRVYKGSFDGFPSLGINRRIGR